MRSRRRVGDLEPEVLSKQVEFAGELRTSQAALLHAAITAAASEPGDLKINCQNLLSLDASILQLLVHWRNRLQTSNQRLVLLNPSDAIRRSLLIGGWPTDELTTDNSQDALSATAING